MNEGRIIKLRLVEITQHCESCDVCRDAGVDFADGTEGDWCNDGRNLLWKLQEYLNQFFEKLNAPWLRCAQALPHESHTWTDHKNGFYCCPGTGAKRPPPQ